MVAAPRTRVLLVDDERVFRQLMGDLLEQYSTVEMVGEASDPIEAIESVGRLKPAVVLMDIHLGKVMDGIATTRVLTIQYPDVVVLGLSCDKREYVASAMREAGAFDVLTKDHSADDIYRAIQRAVASMSDK